MKYLTNLLSESFRKESRYVLLRRLYECEMCESPSTHYALFETFANLPKPDLSPLS